MFINGNEALALQLTSVSSILAVIVNCLNETSNSYRAITWEKIRSYLIKMHPYLDEERQQALSGYVITVDRGGTISN